MNLHIQTALVQASSYVELMPIVKDAKEGVSFFGRRYIYFENYEGTLPINALALKVMFLTKKNINFTQRQDERKALEEIIPQITAIYEKNDARWKNPITLMQLIIRNIVMGADEDKTPKGFRFHWHHDYEEGFDFSEAAPPLSEWLLSQMTKEDIQHVLPTITTFIDLLSVAKKAKGDVSFFGWRHVSVEGCDGTLPITALSQRVEELARTRLSKTKNNPTLLSEAGGDDQQSASISPEELEAYRAIKPRIDAVYEQSYDRAMARNLITRILCSIREIWSHCIKERNDVSRLQWEMHKNIGF